MHHPLNCKEVTTLLTTTDIEILPWRERVVVRFHMVICYVCRRYERQIKLIGSAFRSTIEKNVHPEAIQQTKQRLIQNLLQGGSR